jgi:hypothetical protein
MKDSAVLERTTILEGVVDRMRSVLAALPEEELQVFSERLAQAAEEADTLTPPPPATQRLVNRLGGRAYSAEERVELQALSLLEEFRYRRQLLKESLTTTQVAEILGGSRQAPHERVRSGSLLAVMDRGVLRFPTWQFDPEGENGVVPGLPRVVRRLHLSPLGKVAWLTSPNSYLDGATPLATLKSGQVETIEVLARSAGRT